MRTAFLLLIGGALGCQDFDHPCEAAAEPEVCYDEEAASLEEAPIESAEKITTGDSGTFRIQVFNNDTCNALEHQTVALGPLGGNGSVAALVSVGLCNFNWVTYFCTCYGDVISTQPPSGFGGDGTEVEDIDWRIWL